MTTWLCPLCPYSHTSEDILPAVVKHATSEHPAYLEESATVADMLDQIPALILEARQTLFAPNPDGDEKVRSGKATHPDKIGRWAAILAALDEALETSLFASLAICSRIIWESIDADTKKAHPQPLGTPQWQSEIAWLSRAWPDSQAYLDLADIDWIRAEVRWVWLAIASYAGVRSKPKYLCPTEGCREQMHLSEGDWMTCSAGHQHPGPGRLSREWRRKPPMSTKDLSKALRITPERLWKWKERGKIKPVREEGKTLFWLPWDAIIILYPDVVAEIDKEVAA